MVEVRRITLKYISYCECVGRSTLCNMTEPEKGWKDPESRLDLHNFHENSRSFPESLGAIYMAKSKP